MTSRDWQIAGIEVAVGFAIALIIGRALLWLMPKLQFAQTAYEDAPATHSKKTGTPTMGGIAMLAAIAVCAYWSDGVLRALLVLVFGCALVGFVDDYLAIRAGKNRGLRARTKLLATAVFAIVFLRMTGQGAPYVIFHAAGYALAVPHWAWLLLGILAIVGTIHAVNLTDGLDGLAAGTILPPLATVWCIGIAMGAGVAGAWPAVVAAGIGGVLGFLVYNRYPAKIFMGDTGSLALGALLSGAAICSGEMLLLILLGGVFVAEALSVMLQVTYFKLSGGKRIFRMSPLHHHFEMLGWPETTVTLRFWIASLICSIASLMVVR